MESSPGSRVNRNSCGETIILVALCVLGMVASASLLEGCGYETGGEMMHADELIKRASCFLESRGISTEDKAIFWDEDNKEWTETLHLAEEDPSVRRVLRKLSGKDYQVIRFSPTVDAHLTLGGVFWVFVDKASGQVITYLGSA